jgi:hypothetical protein
MTLASVAEQHPDFGQVDLGATLRTGLGAAAAAELAGKPAPFPKAVSLIWVEEMIRNQCTPTSRDKVKGAVAFVLEHLKEKIFSKACG